MGHLDGRNLLIKTSLGEITRPMAQGFDPLGRQDEDDTEWECIDGHDCPDIESVARADVVDADKAKKACQTQLKHQDVNVGAFVVDGIGTHFKQCTRAEALAAKKPAVGAKMYVIADPTVSKEYRMMKAVAGEGMPTL